MKTHEISSGYNYAIPNNKVNKGKILGAGMGAAAGVAYNAHKAKQLYGYIGKNLEKIQVRHPEITGKWTDVFKATLTPSKDKNSWVTFIKSFVPTKERKGIVFAQNKSAIAQKSVVMGGLVAAAAVVGLTLGAVADKIKNNIENKKANELIKKEQEEYYNSVDVNVD